MHLSENKFVRTASGVWKLDDSKVDGATTNRTPSGTTPVRGTPTASASQPPAQRLTPARGFPAAPQDRGTALYELAKADLTRGNLVSAETNLRLALTFSPNNAEVAAALKRVMEERDKARKAQGPSIR